MGLLGHIPQDVFNIFLGEAADLLGQWDEACCALEKGEDTREALLWVMRCAQNLRRASRGVGLEEFAQTLGSSEELIRELLRSDSQPHKAILDTLTLAHSTLSRWLVGVRTDPDYVEDITALSDAIRICRSGMQRALAESQSMSAGSQDEPSGIQSVHLQKEGSLHANQTISLEQLRIEELIDSVGRLSTQHAVMAQCLKVGERNSETFNNAWDICSQLSIEIQNRAVGLRMTSLVKLFGRIEDYILDLAEERGLALQFDHDGGEVEVDVALIDGLWKTLSQLVMTAFEMDFDTPDERVQVGKLPSIVFKLSATSENGVVRISLEDDGRGIGENEPTNSSTELRRRLDEVRKHLSVISGTVKVISEKDKTSSYQISLPESLRLMDVVVVESLDQIYSLPNQVIDDLVEPGHFKTHTLRGDKQFIEYNSKIYPFVTLSELLEKVPPRQRPRVQASIAIEKAHALLLRCGREPIALGIDRLIGKERSVVTPLAPHLQNVKGIAGTMMTGSGDPVLMVDLVDITDAFWSQRTDREVA
ncbi:MAG: chemotaxis protein CheW [Silvanigrellaceae bacterium]